MLHDPFGPPAGSAFHPMEDVLSLQSLGTDVPQEASFTSGCSATASCGDTVNCGFTGSCGETRGCSWTISCGGTTPAPKLPPTSS